MSVRVGHIQRHKDVHGVSGLGSVADVFEASNGVCVVVWRSAHSSTNVYSHIKDVETVHSHGGKSLVVWDWESPPDPDPMDEVLNGNKPKLSEKEVEEIVEEATEEASKVAAARVAEKMRQKVAEGLEVGTPEEEPKGAERENSKKKPVAKKAPAKKKE